MRACWICLLMLVASPTWAWSAAGHAEIAEAAMAQLGASEQRYFNQRAQALLGNERAKKWRKHLAHYSPVAQSAVWPDTRRDQTLATLFSRFAKTSVPEALLPFASANTQRWHYVNAQYWDRVTQLLLPAPSHKGRCKLRRNGQLERVWAPLLNGYRQAQTPAEQGLIVAFVAHLLADAYQPLHVLASVDADCQSDAGGNGYCLEASGSRCKFNLHRLWDQGFAVFNTPIARPSSTGTGTPVKLGLQLELALVLAPDDAAFIYSVVPLELPGRAYQQRAKGMVEHRSQQAASALATVMRELYALEQR
ncbi:MAG TPA: S1/P1 nuclease [Marinagarivorans sp.]